MRGWQEVCWGDIATLEYGKSLRDYRNNSESVPVYGTNGQVGYTDQVLCEHPGVIIGRKGAYRGVHYSQVPFFVIDTAYYLEPKESDTLDLKYCYYKLLTQNINRLDSGSAIPSTSRDDFYQICFKLPSIDEQIKIKKVLECFDNKIENLQRQNQTLEKIAQTLFKQWFVDFNFPDENGEPYKDSGGEMVASKLGEIPKDWRAGSLSDVLFLNYGKALKAESRREGECLVIGSSGVIGCHDKSLVSAPGIVIGRKGTIGKVLWVEENYYPIDTTFYITDTYQVENLYFHYFLLKRQNFDRLLSDSAVPGLNRDLALSMEVVVPKRKIINNFGVLVESFFTKLHSNKKTIQTLTQTRDTLLPKLMSGQIRIKD